MLTEPRTLGMRNIHQVFIGLVKILLLQGEAHRKDLTAIERVELSPRTAWEIIVPLLVNLISWSRGGKRGREQTARNGSTDETHNRTIYSTLNTECCQGQRRHRRLRQSWVMVTFSNLRLEAWATILIPSSAGHRPSPLSTIGCINQQTDSPGIHVWFIEWGQQAQRTGADPMDQLNAIDNRLCRRLGRTTIDH